MRVVVTQPYVPQYRVPLFSEIASLLESKGHSFAVVAGEPLGDQAKRRDLAGAPWLHRMEGRMLRLGDRGIGLRRLPTAAEQPDLLVTEFDITNSLAWQRGTRRPPKVVLWGHGKPYVTRDTVVRRRLKRVIAGAADHVLTYTEGGRAYVVDELGVPASGVTAIGNAVDTRELVAGHQSAVSMGDAERLRDEWGGGPHALFVGGLDRSKRVPFLLDAARSLHSHSPGSVLVVCGAGADAHLVEQAARDSGAVVYMGRVGRHRIGEIASAVSAMWMPGRVGLVALDSASVGLPVHTVESHFHAPEVEYLDESSLLYLPDEPESFALHSLHAMSSPSAPDRALELPSIELVAGSFVRAILAV